MKINSSFIIPLLFILSVLSPARATEPGRMEGRVVDAETDGPVAGVIVKGKGTFTSTDREGRFSLALNDRTDSVTFRAMGYEALVLPASADVTPVRLMPKATQLDDIIVEAPDIYARGDTLVFNVARYATARDNAIIDIIKRLPGIKVEEDGTIKYQGKPINKFYLDGNDILGGQYGLATNNISHKDVQSVEVMENHQPVKALEGIEFPEEAGINLRLKEGARGRWVGVAQAAAGVQPFLYDGSLYAMRLAPRIQNIVTLKGDNTGWNPADEILDHDFDDMFADGYEKSLWPEYISADMIASPLAERRTRYNLSWLANAITAWKSGDNSMRVALNYTGDRLDYDSGVETDYFDNAIPDFTQHDRLRTRTHDLSAQFFSQVNKRGYYLKDRLTVGFRHDKASSAITGSFNIGQEVGRTTISAVNDLKLVKRNEKRLFTLISRNGFTRRPDFLEAGGDEDVSQSVGTTDFRSTTESRFGRMSRFWKYYVTCGIDLDYHRMNAALTGLGIYDNSGIHNSFLSDVYATPQLDYERSGWYASLTAPLKWIHQTLHGQNDYLNVAPRLYVKRQLTAKSDISASVSYRLGSPQAYLNLEVPVLADYRNLFIGANPGGHSHDISAGVSYRYRNPLRSFFFNISGSYAHRRATMMAEQLFADDFIITTYSGRVSDSDTWNVSSAFSKGLGHSRMVVGCETDATASSASSMRDGDVVPYRQLSAAVKPYFKGSLLKWLSVNYESAYGFTNLTINGERSDTHTLHQRLSATLLPCDELQFTVGAEHYLTVFPEKNTASLCLLDASAVWRLNAKVRLSLTAANLLDRRAYEYVTYGTLSRSEHTFRIRPRSILASVQFRF